MSYGSVNPLKKENNDTDMEQDPLITSKEEDEFVNEQQETPIKGKNTIGKSKWMAYGLMMFVGAFFSAGATLYLSEETGRDLYLRNAPEDEVMSEVSLSGVKPNIVYILMDDVGLNDIDVQSQDQSTPFITELTKKSVRLNRYYSMHMCTPARAALMTGQYPFKVGMQHEVIMPNQPWGLDEKVSIMPEYFNEAGYKSHMVGKWHLGHSSKKYLPTTRGFKSFLGFFGDQIDYKTKQYPFQIDDNEKLYTDWFVSTPYKTSGLTVSDELTTDVFETRAREAMVHHASENPDEPLFLYLSLQNNHGPLTNVDDTHFKADELKLINSMSTPNRQAYTRLNLKLDRFIKNTVQNLKDNGLYENSVIVLASDNGACPQAGGSNFPYRGSKGYLFEGGVKVPAFIHSPLFPNEIQGKEYNGLFHVTDFLPTFLDMAGLDKPDNLDGISHLNALLTMNDENAAKEFPREQIILNADPWETGFIAEKLNLKGMNGGVIMGDMKVLINQYPIGTYDIFAQPPETATHFDCVDLKRDPKNDMKLLQKTDVMVFNLADDPYETTNLASQHLDLASDVQALLAENFAESAYRFADSDASKVWDSKKTYITPWLDEDLSYLEENLLESNDNGVHTWITKNMKN